ncbi:MAG: peptidase MA family metallohydrolase [Chloroflexota bacterium]
MKRLLIVLGLCAVLAAALPVPAVADTSVTVISTGAEAVFPTSITFRLEAESQAEVADIDLEYSVRAMTVVPVICRVDVDFTPGETVSTSWTWDMLETGGLPPGTAVDYVWVIEDASGQVTRSDPSSVAFDDQRHDWNSITRGNVTLLWYQGDSEFAQGLMDTAHEALERLANDIGVSLEQAAELYIYANSQDLREALVYPQEWTGGVAFTDYGIIAIGIAPAQVEWGQRAISHELGHLVVHQAVHGPFGDLPTWLDEGLAMDAEGKLRSDLQARLDQGIASDTLFSVRSICSSFPSDPHEAKLCYGQSYSVVQFLLDTYGRAKLLELLEKFKQGSTCNDALQQIYGFDLDGLNAAWRESVGLPAEQPPHPTNGGTAMPGYSVAVIAITAALGLLFVYLLLRRVVFRAR